MLEKQRKRAYRYGRRSQNDNIPLPVLVDADWKISKGLDLFRIECDHSRVDRNILTASNIDVAGRVQFTCISEKTVDRPNAEYLLRFLDRMILNE